MMSRPAGDPPVDAPDTVWWLQDAVTPDEPDCPPLADSISADVCIVGGGFTGLWTAIELAERAPEISVALLEREGCGFGASGRNGGWVTGWYDELDALLTRFGPVDGLRLAEQSHLAIDRIAEFVAARGIECDFRRKGALWTAMAPAQLSAFAPAVEANRRCGTESMLEPLSGEEVRRRIGSPLPLAAVRHVDAAAVHPGRLVRGLRRAALDLGVSIYEGTPMIDLLRIGPAPVVLTPAGRVAADRVILATGVYSGGFRQLRRAFVPVGSHIVLTEPLGERIAGLPWAAGELFGDARLMVHYAQVTSDGRIAFGRGGGAIGAAGRVVPAHFHDPAAVRSVIADFVRWFPQLAEVRFTHSWGGAVDRAPGHLPFVGSLDADGRVLYGLGYSGNGVGPSALIAKVLAARALDLDDEYASSPLAAGPPGYLPPEPFRSVGGAIVRAAVERAERAEEAGRGAGLAGSLRGLVSATVPRRLEPRKAIAGRRSKPGSE
jgi:glycine/D-amino acid oxidase-like deaminating enzyme